MQTMQEGRLGLEGRGEGHGEADSYSERLKLQKNCLPLVLKSSAWLNLPNAFPPLYEILLYANLV